MVAQFHEAAEELIREKGATSAVAAALAYIAGAKDIVSRSLLSAHQVCYKAWRCTNGLVWIYFKGSACIVPSKCVYGGREASHVQINIFQPIKVHVYIMCSGTCTHYVFWYMYTCTCTCIGAALLDGSDRACGGAIILRTL